MTVGAPAEAYSAEEQLADTARQAIGCDAVLITQVSQGGRRAVVAACGITTQDVRRSWPDLKIAEEQTGLCGGLDGCDVHADSRLGYAQHHCAALEYEGRRVGSLHVFAGDDSFEIDASLFDAFAAHAAVAVAHRQLSHRALRLAELVYHGEAFDRLALSAMTLVELVPRITDALCRVFGPVTAGLMVWDDDRSVLQLVGGSFGAAESATASYQVDPHDLRSNAARVFGLRRPYMSNRAQGDPGILQDYIRAFDVERLISVPLVVGAQPTGVLHVANKQADFSVNDLARCEDLAPRVALAVESTRMVMRLHTQQQLETVFSDVAVAIASGGASECFLPGAFEALRTLFRASMIALVPVESEPIVAACSSSRPADERSLLEEARRVSRESARVIRPQCAGDPGSAVYHIPVRLDSCKIGTLSVLRGQGEAFTHQERRGLARMRDLVSLAWASERYQQHRAALARLEERQHIADDLHDDVAQLLFAAQMRLDEVLDHGALATRETESVMRVRALLTRADTTIRTEISQLSRPCSNDFVDRLNEIVEGIEEEFMLAVHLEISSEAARASRTSRPGITEALLKVAREALVNAAKHAGPCRINVRVDLGGNDRLRLRIVDDGIGVSDTSADAARHGISSLRRTVRRHGGSLRVRQGRSGGTTVAVGMPL